MRKSIITAAAVVFALTSYVSAEFTLTSSGPGPTQWIGIYNDLDNADLNAFFVGLVGGNAVWTGESNVYRPPVPADAPGNTYYGDVLGTGFDCDAGADVDPPRLYPPDGFGNIFRHQATGQQDRGFQ